MRRSFNRAGSAIWAGVLTCSLCAVVLAGAGDAASQRCEGVTRPSKDLTLSFVRPGSIAKVEVKQGDLVQAGQLLVRQDDVAEQAQLAQLKAQAEETIRVRASEAQLAQRKVELEEKEWALERGAATKLEVDHAKLDVTIAELTVELSKFEHEQNKLKYEEIRLQVERMRIKSPITGRAERVFVEAGESVDALKEVIRVVQVDPLWIDVPVPLELGRSLGTGQEAYVAFDRTTPDKPNGRVVHVPAVADPASDTLTVRVEAPNPTGRLAGERLEVSFSSSGTQIANENTANTSVDNVQSGKKE